MEVVTLDAEQELGPPSISSCNRHSRGAVWPVWRGRGGWPGEIVISSHQLRPSCEIVNKNDADQASCWVQHSCSKWVWVGELIADQSCTLEKEIGIAKTTKSGAIKSKAKTPSISGCNQESFSQQEGWVADQGECKVGNYNKTVEPCFGVYVEKFAMKMSVTVRREDTSNG